MPYLAFNLNDGNEFVFDILEERLSIGREASNDIVINNTFISSYHAEFLRQTDGSYEIIDLKSSNGTFLNGKRVERARVKGGDRIMFGQLESRFRERAPKGLAPDSGSKTVAPAKGQPTREDGKKGDTESIPAREKEETQKSTPETGHIEINKPFLPRAPSESPKPPTFTPPISFLPKPATSSALLPAPAPDPAAIRQAAELRDEVEKLTRQRDVLRAENDIEQKRRDEVRLLEATIVARKKELGQTETEINGFKIELEKLRAQEQNFRAEVENAKTEANKFDAKRRDLGNIESKLESTHTLVTKAEADLAIAQKSLQTLHEEAHKQRKERETTLVKLVAEEAAAQAKVAAINQLLATAQQSEAELKTQRSAELQALEAEVTAKRASFDQITAALTQSNAKATTAGEKLAFLQAQVAAAEAELKKVTQLQCEAQKFEAELKSKRSTELQDLDKQLGDRHAELAQLDAQRGTKQDEIKAANATLAKAQEQLRDAESKLAQREGEAKAIAERGTHLVTVQAEVKVLEDKVTNLNHKLDDLASTDTRLNDVTEALKAAESHKAEVVAAVAALVKERDERTRELLAATEHGRAQTLLTQTLTQRREAVEKEVRLIEEQQTETSQAMGKAREQLRLAEHELTEREAQIATAEQRSKNLEELATTADLQFKSAQAEHKKLSELLAQAKTDLEQATVSAIEKNKEAAAAAAAVEKSSQQQLTLVEKISGLEAIIATLTTTHACKQQQLSAAEADHQNLQERLAVRQKESATTEARVAELIQNQEKLKKELSALETSLKTESVRLAELTKNVKTAEAKASDAEKRAEKAISAQEAADKKRAEAEATLESARNEEKNLRKQIPTLNTELAGIQAMLGGLNKEREEAAQFVTRLNVSTENHHKKLTELQQQISQLEAAHQLREERVMKAQAEVDKETTRLKAAQELSRAAELQKADLEKELKDTKVKADAAKKDAAALQDELRERLDRVQNLKAEEERLIKTLDAQKQDIEGADMALKELQTKIEARQVELGDYLKIGGQILGLGQALMGLEARQTEINKSLRQAAEEDLAIQVKLNAAQETLNRESAKAEQARKDREAAEAEFKHFSAEIQKQAATLQNYEVEQKKRIAEQEKRIADLGTMQLRSTGQLEETKAELARLEGRKQEFAQAEAQLKHWQEIEKRLRGQLEELEEKHEIMRRGLPTEDSTVVMFANDIIKRMDLIDALVSRYAGSNGSDVPVQLQTLRASFEDILHQHGVTEFDVPPGTELDIELRKRIAVVDSLPGKAKPRVTESCRSGFIFSRGEGHEIILRKVEVRTSSQ